MNVTGYGEKRRVMLIYEIYISSFCDSTGDGVGDINGIRSKLGYLKNINVDALWITPFYPSPKVDNGYDISCYKSVDELYGTLEEFKYLVNEAHELGLKVFIDVVFNHTSDKHKWFSESIKNNNVYKDYYYWYDEIPNDWESYFGGPAWSYDSKRKQYYLHRFAKEQPDLNLSNPLVKQELLEVLNYWIEFGIDGFRFDVINFVITNEARIHVNNIGDIDKRVDDPGAKDFIKYLRTSISEDIVFIGEVGSEEIEILESYVGEELMGMVFNFNIGSIKKLDINLLYKEISESTNPTMLFSSHDMMRMHTRLSEGNKKVSYLLYELLINYSDNYIVYQGDEMLIDDFIPKNISEVKDISGVNRYNELLKSGMEEAEAFENIKSHTRDYSRKLIDWSTNVDDKFLEITKYKNENIILHKGKVTKTELIDGVICFTKTYANDQVHILLNFNNEEQSINYSGKTYKLLGHSSYKGAK